MSRTLARPAAPVPTPRWGNCRRCAGLNFTLTETGRIPAHTVASGRLDSPPCRGSNQHPAPGSVTPAAAGFCGGGNYQPIPQVRATRRRAA